MSFGFGLSFGFWRVGDKGKLKILKEGRDCLEKNEQERGR